MSLKVESQTGPAQIDSAQWIHGAGEMASLVRARDWSATPLGPIDCWCSELLTTVNLMLASPLPTALFWGESLVMFYNDAYRPFVSLKHPRSLGRPCAEVWRETWSMIECEFVSVLATGEAISRQEILLAIEEEGRLRDHYWNYTLSPVFRGDHVAGVLNVCQNTTTEVLTSRQEQRLQKELERKFLELKAIYETSSVALAMIDPVDFRYLRGNPKLAEILNQPIESIAGMPVFDLANDVLGLRECLEQAAAGVPVTGKIVEGELSNMPGVPRSWQVEYTPVFASDGGVAVIVASSVEITAQRQIQQALIHTEKLAAVGRLASSIAHEINNPLEAATNLIYLARASEDLNEIRQFLDTADREVRRAAVISSQTLRFHKQASKPERVHCAELIDSVLAIYQGRLATSNNRLQRRDRGECMFRCMEGEVRQVLHNLIANALDAMPAQGGSLSLRSREATDWTSGRKGVVLTVADNGIGMSLPTQHKVFEAFFTTKGFAGTGLGLWISREIVERHGGKLRVRSSQGPSASGSVFTLFLPHESPPV